MLIRLKLTEIKGQEQESMIPLRRRTYTIIDSISMWRRNDANSFKINRNKVARTCTIIDINRHEFPGKGINA